MANQHTKRREEETSQIIARLTAMETGYEALSQDVHSIAKSLESFASETRTAIQNLADRISETHRTPWGILASWAAVILTFGALVGASLKAGVDANIRHLSSSVTDLRRIIERHVDVPYHPEAGVAIARSLERNKALSSRIRDLERRLEHHTDCEIDKSDE